MYSYEACEPAGCSCQTRHEANEVTLFPVSAFLSPPCLWEGGGGGASTLWHDMSIQSNIGLQFLHAYENTSCEFACTGHAHQTAASI